MKKITMVLSLLVLMVSTGIASAQEAVYVGPGPRVAAVVAPFPGVRVVVGRPGVYCWYQGRYYSRAAWDHFCRIHPYRYAYRYHHGYRRF
jgi:hypothetical protein